MIPLARARKVAPLSLEMPSLSSLKEYGVHLFKSILYFSLLVLKGIYHWTYLIFFQGPKKKMEDGEPASAEWQSQPQVKLESENNEIQRSRLLLARVWPRVSRKRRAAILSHQSWEPVFQQNLLQLGLHACFHSPGSPMSRCLRAASIHCCGSFSLELPHSLCVCVCACLLLLHACYHIQLPLAGWHDFSACISFVACSTWHPQSQMFRCRIDFEAGSPA